MEMCENFLLASWAVKFKFDRIRFVCFSGIFVVQITILNSGYKLLSLIRSVFMLNLDFKDFDLNSLKLVILKIYRFLTSYF